MLLICLVPSATKCFTEGIKCFTWLARKASRIATTLSKHPSQTSLIKCPDEMPIQPMQETELVSFQELLTWHIEVAASSLCKDTSKLIMHFYADLKFNENKSLAYQVWWEHHMWREQYFGALYVEKHVNLLSHVILLCMWLCSHIIFITYIFKKYKQAIFPVLLIP